MQKSNELSVIVEEVRQLTPLIKCLRLRAADGGVLPGFTAGAHVKVHVELPEGEGKRNYSLINPSWAEDATATPREYLIAVRLEESGQGGSRYMHTQVNAGDTIKITRPLNEFELDLAATDTVLIAGGIGITPILSMASTLRARGKNFTLHYSGRARNLLAFVPELEAIAGERMRIYADDEPDNSLSVSQLLATCSPQQHLYCCGPKGMIDAVIAEGEKRGWMREHIHFELFAEAGAQVGDHAFELVLQQSGKTLQVPADKTILDVLIEAGLDPLFDCKRGECGVCTVSVVSGEIDHRDYYLSPSEKASGKVMQVCISRAKGPLVLDI